MIEIKAKLKIRRSAYNVEVKDRLELSFEQRQKTRLRTRLASGEEAALLLPRGEMLRGGDLVTASDGRVVEVLAAREKLLHVESSSLAAAAYHLGNRHVPVQFGDGFLRITEDQVLEDMLRKLGAKLSHVEEPFEPDVGAYDGGQPHGETAHPHDHDHDHDHGHGHHHHGHKHDHD
jgi:urease accessory protein